MAETDDSAADVGQPVTTTEGITAGPGPPNVAVGAMAHEGGKADNVGAKKDVNASQVSFKLPQAVQKSPLLSLPPEIRNTIWKRCLLHPANLGDKMTLKKKYGCFTMLIKQSYDEARPKIREAYETSLTARTKSSIKNWSGRNLALMETCQAAYMDAAPVLWGQRFTFHSILQLQAFLFSNARLDLVRHIHVWTLDQQVGVNYMPSICALLADKITGLDRFEIDQSRMRKSKGRWGRQLAFYTDEEVKEAGVNLGFDIYACMHPWVTKVVQEQGVEKLLDILQIKREIRGEDDANCKVHADFRGGGQLTAEQREIADTATAGEIVRLVKLYEKKA